MLRTSDRDDAVNAELTDILCLDLRGLTPWSRHLKVKSSRINTAHLSMLSRTVSTLWINVLKVGRSLVSLLQHSVMIL